MDQGPGWLVLVSLCAVLNGLFAILVMYQWRTTGMSIADPLFKPVSGNALAFQMAGAMVLFCMTIFGVTFATGAANMLSEENCKVWLGHGGEQAQSCSYDTDFVVQAVLAATNVGVMYCLSMEIPIGEYSA